MRSTHTIVLGSLLVLSWCVWSSTVTHAATSTVSSKLVYSPVVPGSLSISSQGDLASRLLSQPLVSPLTSSSPEVIALPPLVVQVPTSLGYTGKGLDADKLFAIVQAHRESLHLAPFQKDERACQLAQSRAPEIEDEVAGGYMHRGLHDRNLPYWNTENIITMHSEEAAFQWWINDYIHRIAIEGAYTYSCTACAGRACAQEFTNFQRK